MITGKVGRPETEKPVPKTVIAEIVTELAEVVGFSTLNVSTELAPLPGRTCPNEIGVAACGKVRMPVASV